MRPKFSEETVRQLAVSEGFKEAYFNERSKVISFTKPGEKIHCVKINVYYTTGTVGTCVDHPVQGRTQLFRRNVDLEQLRMIFRNPHVHTGKGYHRRHPSDDCKPSQKRARLDLVDLTKSFSIGSRAYVKGYSNCTFLSKVILDYGPYDGKIKVRYDDGSTFHVDPHQLDDVLEEVVDEESAISKQINFLKKERDSLDSKTSELQEMLNEIDRLKIIAEEEARREKERLKRIAEEEARRERERLQRIAEEEKKRERERLARIAAEKKESERLEKERRKQAALEFERRRRGKYVATWIADGDFVKRNFSEGVTAISCRGNATIMLYEWGSWAWTSGIPKFLHNKLNGRQRTLPKPTYVAIGSFE